MLVQAWLKTSRMPEKLWQQTAVTQKCSTRCYVSSFRGIAPLRERKQAKKKFLAFEWDLRDIDGATHFQGIAMQL